MRLLLSSLSVLLCAALAHGGAHAAEAQVAVAANFAEPIKAIAAVLHKTTGHTLKVSACSTRSTAPASSIWPATSAGSAGSRRRTPQ